MDANQILAAFADSALPSDTQLARVSTLAAELKGLEAEETRLQGLIEACQGRQRVIQTRVLPAVMKEIGLSSFKLTDGHIVEVGQITYANISEARRSEAHAWLREHNSGDIIKNVYQIDFGKGDDAKAADLEQTLKESGYDYERKEAVNAQTLKAFVREQLTAGVELPMALFGAYVEDVAEITVPKAPRKKKGAK